VQIYIHARRPCWKENLFLPRGPPGMYIYLHEKGFARSLPSMKVSRSLPSKRGLRGLQVSSLHKGFKGFARSLPSMKVSRSLPSKRGLRGLHGLFPS